MDKRAGEETSDEDLMHAIAQGDELAFEALYDRYSSLLYGLCLRMLGKRSDAEALLTEVFFEVWEKADRYESYRGSLRTYLVMLTRSRAIDKSRSESSRRAAEEVAGKPVFSSTAHPLQAIIQEENRDIVRQAVNELTDLERQALFLAFFDGLSYRQVALQLDKPLGTMKSIIRRALHRLRQALRSSGVLRGDE